MRKIINDPEMVVDESVQGFLKAHSGLVEASDNPRVLVSKNAAQPGRVGIVTGGGSGHKPAFIGYIGENMLDAVAVGEVFSSPPAQAFFDAIKSADSGNGVACLYGNYAGDKMNMKMAEKMAADAGIKVKSVIANDDAASAPADQPNKRRGVAGEIFMWKVAGAASAKGYNLEEVVSAAQKAIDNTRSVGVGLSSCTLPQLGHPNFDIEEGKMEFGIGHHGEPGIEITDLESAKIIAERMCSTVIEDLPFNSGDDVAVIVSGLGATPLQELYILFNEISGILELSEINIHTSLVGNYFTSLEMQGATFTIMRLDSEMKELLSFPARSPGLIVTGG
ncbi:MAG: dihydroxyacetone kinase subunit DhaK [Spirochaetales bacterium]|uniref:Dihydroxyacetone kinase subunit DhaK n=1 Tax=Candidatus Thalassospirochaeta sargassi TaxID=3119039 RepID=A0AAJ1IB36_9SPIO|nr:dihydroxyacetone kinase subunit DhaK [Spirochaetales bacterium]